MGCTGNSGAEVKNSSDNYILTEFDVNEENAEEEQNLYNLEYTDTKENGEEIKSAKRECEIKINEKIYSNHMYKFPKEGIYTVKFIFKKPIDDATKLFWQCECLKKVDLTHFQGNNLTKMAQMFNFCGKLESADFSNLDLQNVTDMSDMLSACEKLKTVNFSGVKTKKLENMNSLFGNCSSLESADLSSLNTENVKNMEDLFTNCSALKSVNLTKNFNTRNVTKMGSMFYSCSALENINLSNFDTSY